MNEDAEQLRQYAESGAEDAFAAVVQRYLPLVFRAARRRVGGDEHRAEDVTQLVFTALARNAAALAQHPDLTGWLFTTTRFLAAKAVRGERRRQAREQEASMTQSTTTDDLRPEAPTALPAVLDDVMMELRQLDRQMILLRFHRGLRLAEIGAQLGATENAVQKRLDRALDQLKDKLAQRGITSTAAALALAFEQQTAIAVPAGLAAAATTAGLAGGAGAGGLLAVSSLMAISKLQLSIAAAAVVATSAGLVWEVRENTQLRGELAAHAAATAASTTQLQQQLATLAQRTAAAEADAAKLKQAIQAAARATPAPGARVLTDTQDLTNAAMARADQLRREGKLQEALDEYMKCYRGLRNRPTRSAGSLDRGRLMQGITGLGRTFPPAMVALRELRDEAMQQREAHPEDREIIGEIGTLNERLGEGSRSVALYDSLPPNDPGRQALATISRDSFVEARRYDDALVGTKFGGMVRELDMGVQSGARLTGQSLVNHTEFVVKGTLTNIETLVGAGKLEEARVLQEKLFAFDGSEATRAAVKQRRERAGQPASP